MTVTAPNGTVFLRSTFDWAVGKSFYTFPLTYRWATGEYFWQRPSATGVGTWKFSWSFPDIQTCSWGLAIT